MRPTEDQIERLREELGDKSPKTNSERWAVFRAANISWPEEEGMSDDAILYALRVIFPGDKR